METNHNIELELVSIIVNFGLGSKLLHKAKKHGASGGTIALAKGTSNKGIWDFLGLSDIRKEIVYIVSDKDTATNIIKALDKEYNFDKPNHGIVYTTNVCSTNGCSQYTNCACKSEVKKESVMYHLIICIVDKGRAEEVIEAASKGGSKGGTIMNARGSGIHETGKVFSMDIEPEKEVVIIVSEAHLTESITSNIVNELDIELPGNGIIYVQDINSCYGVHK